MPGAAMSEKVDLSEKQGKVLSFETPLFLKESWSLSKSFFHYINVQTAETTTTHARYGIINYIVIIRQFAVLIKLYI